MREVAASLGAEGGLHLVHELRGMRGLHLVHELRGMRGRGTNPGALVAIKAQELRARHESTGQRWGFSADDRLVRPPLPPRRSLAQEGASALRWGAWALAQAAKVSSSAEDDEATIPQQGALCGGSGRSAPVADTPLPRPKRGRDAAEGALVTTADPDQRLKGKVVHWNWDGYGFIERFDREAHAAYS
eukprot:gene24395-62179_t